MMEVMAEHYVAVLGGLGDDEADRLHAYCRDALLDPLGLVETSNSLKVEGSIVEIPPPCGAVEKRQDKISNCVKKEKENIPPYPSHKPEQVARRRRIGNLHKDEEDIGQWLASVESGEDVLEDEEVMTTAANTEVDAESDGSMVTCVNLC
jgi:hypothetical protein